MAKQYGRCAPVSCNRAGRKGIGTQPRQQRRLAQRNQQEGKAGGHHLRRQIGVEVVGSEAERRRYAGQRHERCAEAGPLLKHAGAPVLCVQFQNLNGRGTDAQLQYAVAAGRQETAPRQRHDRADGRVSRKGQFAGWCPNANAGGAAGR